MTTKVEKVISSILANVWRFTVTRLAAVTAASIYVVLFLLAPTQLVDALRGEWSDGNKALWALFLVPPVAAGVGHLALMRENVAVKRRADFWLTILPSITLTLMVYRWVPSALFAAVLMLVLSILILRYLQTAIVISRGPWRRFAVLMTLGCFAFCVIAFQVSSQAFPVALGPLVTLTLGLAILCLTIAIGLLRPVIAGTYLIICTVASLVLPDRTYVQLVDESLHAASPGYSLRDGLYLWLRARKDLDVYRETRRPYPVIIVAAEGGGIYAAAHSYLTLSAVGAICPNFRQHLFATVGVSGGAVGTLWYAAQESLDANPETVSPCEYRERQIDLMPLTTDHLSPTLANLLFLRPADFLIPGPAFFRDGGETLTDSIARMDIGNGKLTEPLRASWDPTGSDPATLFVATDVLTGNRFVFSPLADVGGSGVETFPSGSTTSLRDIARSSAAVVSSRFPWLTSTALLEIQENSSRVLADGGYFENSGSDTSLDLIQEIRSFGRESMNCPEGGVIKVGGEDACKCRLLISSKFSESVAWSGCDIHIFLVFVPMSGALEGALGYSLGNSSSSERSYFGDPLAATLRARAARDQLQMIRARAAFNPNDPEGVQEQSADAGYFPQQLAVDDLNLPLGWKMSTESATAILQFAASTGACQYQREDDSAEPRGVSEPASELAMTPAATRVEAIAYDNGCNVRMLAWLFDPAMTGTGIGIKRY